MGCTVRGSNPVGGEIFCTCPGWPWGPPSLLYNGYRVFPGGKEQLGRDADPSSPSSAVGHERVELYLYSPYGPYGLYRASVPVQGCTLPVFFIYNCQCFRWVQELVLHFLKYYELIGFIKKNPTRCKNISKFYYSIFIWSSECFGRHATHHQEPKIALAASGFSYVEGCCTCSWWTSSGSAWRCPPTARTTTFHVRKTRGCQCSFRLLMMGGMSPETCWASYKYGIIKFWYIVVSCWIFPYESFYDARIHRRQDCELS